MAVEHLMNMNFFMNTAPGTTGFSFLRIFFFVFLDWSYHTRQIYTAYTGYVLSMILMTNSIKYENGAAVFASVTVMVIPNM